MEQHFCVTRVITTLLQTPLDLFADAKETKTKKTPASNNNAAN